MEFKPKLVEHFEQGGRFTTIYYEAHVQCQGCKRITKIRVHKNSKHIYTEEILKNWKCPLCLPFKK